jgi:hypothetical protein
MLRDFLSRLTQSRLWQQARTIWRVATHAGATRKNEGLDLFLAGHSIGRVSALLLPGVGGPAIVAKQGEILDALREYTLDQEKLVLELRDEVAELRAALNDLVKPESTPAGAPAGQAADLLGQMLGI